MKTIVTGGAGFIGSHLVDRLLKDGHQVLVLDNFSNGRKENLAHHAENKNLVTIEVDISEYDKIFEYFKEIDWVFHLAGLADIVPSIEEPLKYHKSNVDGTIAVLEASRINNIKKLVYAASSSCYGIPDDVPTKEDSEIKPQYPYALTKYLGEECVMHWGKVYDLPVISLRLFNVYGPRSRTTGTYGAVFGVFLAQKLAEKPYTVVGDGKQSRDFTFVTDVVDAFVKSAEKNVSNEIMNVGTGNDQSILKLVELLGGEIEHIPKRPGEPDRTCADNNKIKKLLGWETKVSFEEGVKIMLDNISNWKDAPVWNKESINDATKEWFEHLSNDKNN